MELSRAIAKHLNPLLRRLRTIATRGVVKLVDPATMLQELQVAALGDELLDKIEHWESYGFTSSPHEGAEALLLSLGGDRDHTVAVNVADRRYRIKGLESGEVALYTDEGDVIHFKRGNHIYVDAMTKVTVKAPNVDVVASTEILLDTPLVRCTGNIEAAGDITDHTCSVQSVRDTYNGHTHPGDSGGTTGSPNQGM